MPSKINIASVSKPSVLLIVFCFCFSIFTMDLWREWHFGKTNFIWDVGNYYSYLPAKFCNNNSFEFNNGLELYLPVSPTGKRMSKVTYGMSVLYAPFFALGYKIAINQNSPRDGFSEPFKTAVHWGSIFYGLLGLVLLRNLLIRFFTEYVVAFTLAIVFFGTTLFYYTLGNSEMTHSYLFFLISAFLLLTYHWHQKPGWLKTIGLGMVVGLICLIRPSEILVGLLFVFWNVTNFSDLKERLGMFWKLKWHLLLILALMLLYWVPQLLYWKEFAGTYFYDSFPGEKFFWADPQIFNILLSYRKGWITYSPLVLLVFVGFFFMSGEVKKLRPVILFLFLFNIYLLSCWWNWFFGGGFGARGFTQHFAFLSFPIAAACNFFMNEQNFKPALRFLRVLFFAFVFSGISLSLGQSYQYARYYIHYDGMTKETYWLVFGKYYFDEEHNNKFWGSVKQVDHDKLKSGEDRNQ